MNSVIAVHNTFSRNWIYRNTSMPVLKQTINKKK